MDMAREACGVAICVFELYDDRSISLQYHYCLKTLSSLLDMAGEPERARGILIIVIDLENRHCFFSDFP